MKKSVLIILMFLILIPITVKADIKVNIEPVKDTILRGGDAVYIVTLKNDDKFESLDLSTSDDFFRAKVEPRIFSLKPEEEVKIKIVMSALNNAQPGRYVVTMPVWSVLTNEKRNSAPMTVILADPNNLISHEFLNNQIDPRRDDSLIQIKFKNNYNLMLDNVNVELVSDLFSVKKTIRLEPLSEVVEDFIIDIDDNTKEGEYLLKIVYDVNGNKAEKKDSIRVAKFSDVKKTTETEGNLFSSIRKIVIENDGNNEIKEKHVEELNFVQRLFTGANPKPSSVERKNGKYILSWVFDVKPGDKQELEISTRYRGFFMIIGLLLLAFGGGYYYFSKDVKIDKKVIHVKGEHGLSKAKVLISVKNTGVKPVSNVRVMDRVPHLVKPVTSATLISPTIIKKSDYGHAMIWDIQNLAKDEERVLTYDIESQLGIIGRFNLPSAFVKYRDETGKVLSSSSNKLFLFSASE